MTGPDSFVHGKLWGALWGFLTGILIVPAWRAGKRRADRLDPRP
jgi:hypothetical protein